MGLDHVEPVPTEVVTSTVPASTSRARVALRFLWVTAALAGVLASDVDPFVVQRAGGMLALPNRRPLWAAEGLLLLLTVALMLASRRARRLSQALAILVATQCGLLLLLATPFARPGVHGLSALLMLGTLAALAGYLLATHGERDPGRMVLENGVTTVLAVAAVLLVGEAVAVALPASHAVGYTLASRLWYAKYWNPSNRAGFRDAERDAEPGRRIYVIGDSFVAGVGIADIQQRFSNILHRHLAPEFRVYNLGRNGAATGDEYRLLLEQRESPDLLILSYYVNDIQDACEAARGRLPGFTPYANLPSLAGWVVQRSYLLDLFYWRFPQPDLFGYERALQECYASPEILAAHLADLDRFVGHCRAHAIPLVVVAFPDLVNTAPTHERIQPVIRRLKEQAVPVVDVYSLVEGLPLSERTVNPNDAHPSARLNKLVADQLLAVLESDGLLAQARVR